ncbi:MAG TPA: phenylalanine--tRNA ligase subunit alpha [Burkholderiales bacterium]|jgi:phenylalanyl-tRNA synthetase alpha chain|nr:phenylalanine--tRNA ligase subunit alpha [Burkholderiales bacterium]
MSAGDDAVRAIEDGLEALGTRYRDAFGAASSEQALRDAYAQILGKKKGELTRVMALMRDVPNSERPRVGARVNDFKQAVEKAFDERLKALAQAARRADLEGRPYDLTLPGRVLPGRGHLHPVLQTRDDLLVIFRDLGFEVVPGPEVELEENNFTKLAFPPDHPATDMQDTFWVDVLGPDGSPRRAPTLLRTHTSNTQIRVMSSRKPPMAVVSAGAVYRRDDDLTHSPMFHQIEGFLVDVGVSMTDLKGVLSAFAEALYGPGTPVRLRPSYFPFVEPGAEVDIGCTFCRAENRGQCRVCKGSGWLEVLGCGMIHPQVLLNCGIDPERFSGYAFGMGIERIAMLRYGIPSIKLLFENDPRFIAQFT